MTIKFRYCDGFSDISVGKHWVLFFMRKALHCIPPTTL